MSDRDLLVQELPNIFHAYTVDLVPDEAEAWISVTRSTASEARVVTARNLVLAAHGQGISDHMRAQLVDRVRAQHDGAFPSEGRDGALRALSSAALVALLDGEIGAAPSSAALGVLAAHFNGWSSPATILPDLAGRYLKKGGRAARRRTDLPDVRASTVTGKLSSLKEVQWAAPMDAHPFVEEQAVALRQLARQSEQLAAAMKSRQEAHDEEVDLLWWAVNGHDKRARRWETLPLGLRVALAAREAADRTRFIPGPPEVETLILRAVGEVDGETDATEIVTEAAAGWKDAGQTPSERRGPLFPLLTSLSEAIDMDGNSSWIDVAAHKHHIRLPEGVSVAELASEFYREFLAARIDDAKE